MAIKSDRQKPCYGSLAVWQEMKVANEAYCITVVPEGIYYILSWIEGDTVGTVRRQGVKHSSPVRSHYQYVAHLDNTSLSDDLMFTTYHSNNDTSGNIFK